jgi:uncharacterized protein (TIGR02452 family)
MDFQQNITTWNDTVKICNNLKTQNIIPNKSIKYNFKDMQINSTHIKYENTEICVLNKDCISCAIIFKQKNMNPVVLNLADDKFPGGHVQMGSGAQEESLFRRTNYFQTLNHETHFYPIIKDQLVYSPNVRIIKDNDNKQIIYNEKNKSIELSFIACPGIQNPECTDNHKLKDSDVLILEQKIRNILNVSYKHGHDIVILGALGCGAWRCPPYHVATIFKKITLEYNKLFKAIIFAVLEVDDDKYIVKNREKKESNYKIFKS